MIGVGGIFTAQDVYSKMRAGATLVQAYTGFIYGGPGFPLELVDGLQKIMKAEGFSKLSQIVGLDAIKQ